LLTYTTNRCAQIEKGNLEEYPHFHPSSATFSTTSEIKMNENILNSYQKLIRIESEKTKEELGKKEKTIFPLYLKPEIYALIIISFISFIMLIISFVNISEIQIMLWAGLLGLGLISFSSIIIFSYFWKSV